MACLHGDSMCQIGKKIWMLGAEYNILFECENIYGKVERIEKLPYEQDQNRDRYRQISAYKNLIFIYPYQSDKLLVFNIDTREFSEIPLLNRNYEFLYSRYIGLYMDRLLLFLIDCCAIIEINVQDWSQKIHWLNQKFRHRIASNDIKHAGDNIILPICDENIILVYDLKSNQLEEICISDYEGGINTVAFDGQSYWLTGNSKEIIKWNVTHKSIETKISLPEGIKIYLPPKENNKKVWIDLNKANEESAVPFLKSIFFNGFVFLFPFRSNIIMKIEVESGEISICWLNPDSGMRDKKLFEALYLCEEKKLVFGMNHKDNNVLLDMEKLIPEQISYMVASTELEKRFYEEILLEYGRKLTELQGLDIEDMLSILNKNPENEKIIQEKSSIGKNIYEVIGDHI